MSRLVFLFFAACCVFASTLPAQTHLIKKTVVGGEGFWDYLTVDSASRQLYLSHGNQVVVLNSDTHAQMGIVADTKGVHGVTVVPELQKGYITCGRTNTVQVINAKTFEKIGEIPAGKGPDAGMYDPYSGKVFIFNHSGGTVTVIDPASDKVAGTIEIGGDLEAGVSDGRGTIFVNVEDKSEIAAFDAKTFVVKNRYKTAPGEEPTGLAIDAARHRLITVCGNKKMLVLDSDNGKTIAQLPIGDHCDGVIFDPGTNQAVSSNGDGTLTVVQGNGSDVYQVKETVTTEKGARTIAFDPKTHHVFVVTAQYGEKPAATPEQPNPRPKIVPGSFTLLEYGQ
jgi:YVTN family beta-propeller protein